MGKIIVILIFLGLINCKESQGEIRTDTSETNLEMEVSETQYPENFLKVLESHGGLKKWTSKCTLTFEIPKRDAPEKHIVDLYSRRDKIETTHFSMGFDGDKVWLKDANNEYKGDAEVYHNLMFYFYAMPFVLADKGIHYTETEDLVFDGRRYPGIQINFDDGVGASSKDDYFLHYDPETYQMAWLGYTFTYGSNEKSGDVKWIRYDDWINVDGVKLPKSITWYAYEGRDLKEPKSKVAFENVSLNESPKPAEFYEKPM